MSTTIKYTNFHGEPISEQQVEVSDFYCKEIYVDNDLKKSIAEYAKNHSLVATAKAFKLSLSTINNYKNYQAPESAV